MSQERNIRPITPGTERLFTQDPSFTLVPQVPQDLTDYSPQYTEADRYAIERRTYNTAALGHSMEDMGRNIWRAVRAKMPEEGRKMVYGDLVAHFGDIRMSSDIGAEKRNPRKPGKVTLTCTGEYNEPITGRVDNADNPSIWNSLKEHIKTTREGFGKPPETKIAVIFGPEEKIDDATITWTPTSLESQKELFQGYQALYPLMESVTRQTDQYTQSLLKENPKEAEKNPNPKQACILRLEPPYGMYLTSIVELTPPIQKDLKTLYTYDPDTHSYVRDEASHGTNLKNGVETQQQYPAVLIAPLLGDMVELVKFKFENEEKPKPPRV